MCDGAETRSAIAPLNVRGSGNMEAVGAGLSGMKSGLDVVDAGATVRYMAMHRCGAVYDVRRIETRARRLAS